MYSREPFTNGQNHLASSRARKQRHHLSTTFGGLLLFISAYACGQIMQYLEWVTPLFDRTLLWCLLPYGLASYLLYHTVYMPSAEQRIMVLIHSALPYLVLALFFALLQYDYARSALLMSAVLTTALFWFRNKLVDTRLKLLVLDNECMVALEKQIGDNSTNTTFAIDYVYWPSNQIQPPDCDGALVSNQLVPDANQQNKLTQLKLNHIRIYSVASVTEQLTGRKSPDVLNNLLWQPDGNPAYDVFKRLADVILVFLLSPIWLFIGLMVILAIKIDSKGPALFTQIRTGLHGHPFQIWKFRTMIPQKTDIAQFAGSNDQRITRLGRFLRKSRLDEIPQLYNVLRGDMSLIGPRPEQHAFVQDFATRIPSYPYRHLVRPGLTGWAQVMQGYAANDEETSVKLSYDLYYVSHYSLAVDLLIVAKTIKTILTGFGAR